MSWSKAALLTVEEMAAADAMTIADGVPGIDLMETAGQAVAAHVTRTYPGQPVIVICGPGNNGGDGYIAGRLLDAAGIPVRLYSLVARESLTGDAAEAAARYQGHWQQITDQIDDPLLADPDGVVIDALFGAGLTRPLAGIAGELAARLNGSGASVVAVDIPSGVMGNTGEVPGPAVEATSTITFCRPKPAHFLMPGAGRCGLVSVVDIGISDDVVDRQNPATWVNDPDIWWPSFPQPGPFDHKYSRGHAVIWGGTDMPGAAVLAGAGARRAGAGMATILAAPEAVSVFQAAAPGVLVRKCASIDAYQQFISGEKCHVLLLGPGSSVSAETRDRVFAALATKKPAVIDADGLSAFADQPSELSAALHHDCVITPHEGEFTRLFDTEGDRLSRARAAARETGATVILKGFDTVIAAPDGRAIINGNGSPYLASAGTGDVLAGMITGLMGQGMTPFLAAAAGVWLHSAAAERIGQGLIAEDLPNQLPAVFDGLSKK